jgi:DNA-binding beta-propeller fold protein YncE
MTARATSAARLGILVAATLCAALLVVGCGTSGSGSTDAGTTPSSGDASAVATPAGDTTGDKISDTTAPTPAATVDRAEIERRLALPRFAYVPESERQGTARAFGALAFIDSETDTLAFRPRVGSDLGRVAVAPDGRLIYVTDQDEPVVWVVDAETHQKVRSIRLPGVRPHKSGGAKTATGKYSFAQLLPCSSAVACTPDGALVLVLSTAGLQVIDTASGEVVRTLPELRDGMEVAVSFDGKHAYIATVDSLTRGKHTMLEWVNMSIEGVGGGLALLDLETWQVVKRVKCGEIGGIAVDPDDSRIFCSDFKLKALRIVDPATLADIAVVSLKSAKAKYFQPRGVGVLPDGSKAYVVCAAVMPTSGQMASAATAGASPDLFFCGVVDTQTREVVKRIPLDAY